MSSANNMDDVPVKVVERYKPPPLVYQLPQTIANRLTQYTPNYYEQGQAYKYDFQLERSVVSKCQHWRQMRHQHQQARQVRQEQRKRERQRELEAKQKEMLGAVDYPNAEDLSSGSDDDEEVEITPTTSPKTLATTSLSAAESREQQQLQQQKPEPKSINSCNVHNILQPTILSGTAAATAPVVTNHKRNSSLNYADFEYNMNSTPFDNIELKTINDLDILAQVLHQTQMTQKPEASEQQEEEKLPQSPLSQEQQPQEQSELNPERQQQVPVKLELAVTSLAETKATLDSVNFQVHCDDAQDIPAMYPPVVNATLYNSPQQQQHQQQQFYPHMVYNPHYYTQQQQQLFHNHNYLQHGYANGYGTPTHQPQIPTTNNISSLLSTAQQTDEKSKSVPDILRELKTELQQAEKRRTRLHSHNENDQQHQKLPLTLPQQQQSQSSLGNNANIFQELAVPAQNLAQQISSMGFPLERVAKVVSLCGVDDKKVGAAVFSEL